MNIRVPSKPLIELVEAAGGPRAAGIPSGRSGDRLARAYHRAVARGWLNIAAADDLAINMLGIHPILIWGDDFLTGTENDNDPDGTDDGIVEDPGVT